MLSSDDLKRLRVAAHLVATGIAPQRIVKMMERVTEEDLLCGTFYFELEQEFGVAKADLKITLRRREPVSDPEIAAEINRAYSLSRLVAVVPADGGRTADDLPECQP